MGIYLRIKKEDCEGITSSQLDNGLLELVAPKNCNNDDLNQYLNGMRTELCQIEADQKKATKAFRKEVESLIEKYRDEFGLKKLTISLRVKANTRKLNDEKIEVHGIDFEGFITLLAILQFAPKDVIEKVIRYSVYDLACQFEQRWSGITGITAGMADIPSEDTISEEKSDVQEDSRYKMKISYDETQKLFADYKDATNQFSAYLSKNPISSIG